MLVEIAYTGLSYVLPLYLANIVGFSFAASAGLSVVFTATGIVGQIVWPTISDYIGRKATLIICGGWMAVGVGLFYFATNITMVVAVQLFFGLVANAVWPIFYGVVTDAAPPAGRSTANGIVTTAMFIGGGAAPLLMGFIIGAGGGWESATGYNITFFTMAAAAIIGLVLQTLTKRQSAGLPSHRDA
jgi:MFS family permease